MNPTITVDPTIIAAAAVTVIAALGGMVVQIVNAWSAAKDRREAAAERAALAAQAHVTAKMGEATSRKADELIVSTAKIHELTNSTNSNLQKALEVSTERIAGLERLLRQLYADRVEAATLSAVTDRRVATALAQPSPGQTGDAAVAHDAAVAKIAVLEADAKRGAESAAAAPSATLKRVDATTLATLKAVTDT